MSLFHSPTAPHSKVFGLFPCHFPDVGPLSFSSRVLHFSPFDHVAIRDRFFSFQYFFWPAPPHRGQFSLLFLPFFFSLCPFLVVFYFPSHFSAFFFAFFFPVRCKRFESALLSSCRLYVFQSLFGAMPLGPPPPPLPISFLTRVSFWFGVMDATYLCPLFSPPLKWTLR